MTLPEFYTEKLLKELNGWTVCGTVIDEDSEYYGIRFLNPYGSKEVEYRILWLLSDDEGNAPGSFDIQDE